MFPQTENGTNGKLQLTFVFCKHKAEMANFCFFPANEMEIGSLFFLVGK
jgi:hypothetical protein